MTKQGLFLLSPTTLILISVTLLAVASAHPTTIGSVEENQGNTIARLGILRMIAQKMVDKDGDRRLMNQIK